MMEPTRMHATTILGVRRNGQVALGSDGQVTLNQTVMKHKAKKIRRMYHEKVLGGFAGSAADGLALFEKFEGKLEEFRGNLVRAAVELAKDWRTDKILRRLEAMMVLGDPEHLIIVSGTGDVIEPDEDIAAVGSGGPFAQAAATALLANTELTAEQIVRESLRIAAGICIYTNQELTVDVL